METEVLSRAMRRMQSRNVKRKEKHLVSPLDVVAMHQKVGQEDADLIALPLLLHLDASHRGLGNGVSADFLFQHILTAQIMSSRAGNRVIYDMSAAAISALLKAMARPAKFLSFTTGEYQAIRKCISAYLRVLPTATLLAVNYAASKAIEILRAEDKEAA